MGPSRDGSRCVCARTVGYWCKGVDTGGVPSGGSRSLLPSRTTDLVRLVTVLVVRNGSVLTPLGLRPKVRSPGERVRLSSRRIRETNESRIVSRIRSCKVTRTVCLVLLRSVFLSVFLSKVPLTTSFGKGGFVYEKGRFRFSQTLTLKSPFSNCSGSEETVTDRNNSLCLFTPTIRGPRVLRTVSLECPSLRHYSPTRPGRTDERTLFLTGSGTGSPSYLFRE